RGVQPPARPQRNARTFSLLSVISALMFHLMVRRANQLTLFSTPRRKKRGRPAKKGGALPHRSRPPVTPDRPHHVTVRMRRGTWNLRSQRCFRHIHAALVGVRSRGTFRVAHYSVQGNHVHLIVEADTRRAMSNGMRAL